MKNSEKSFISSTSWTERIGNIAALSTIKYMKKYKTYKFIKQQGLKIKSMWKKISNKYHVEIDVISFDSIPIFIFKNNHNRKKTYLTQEMLKAKILASNIIYVSIFHEDKIINKYFRNLDSIFKILSETKITEIKKKIKGGESYSPMTRLN